MYALSVPHALRTMTRATAAAAALMLLCSACTSDGGPATTPATSTQSPEPPALAPTVRLHASLVQQRTDEGTNVIDVRLTNTGKSPVRVEKVHLTWEGVAGTPTSGTGTDYDPGRIIDIKTTFGMTVCDADPSAAVHVDVTLSEEKTITLPVDRDGIELLRRLFDRDCALRAIAAVADIALSTTFTRAPGGEDRLLGSVQVTRTVQSQTGDRRELSIVEITGSILFDLTYDGDEKLPLLLAPDVDSLNIPVVLGVGNRCDAHALAESRATFLFGVYARVGQGPAQRVIVSPNATVRRQASAMITRVCS